MSDEQQVADDQVEIDKVLAYYRAEVAQLHDRVIMLRALLDQTREERDLLRRELGKTLPATDTLEGEERTADESAIP